jgi:hypothetical protein
VISRRAPCARQLVRTSARPPRRALGSATESVTVAFWRNCDTNGYRPALKVARRDLCPARFGRFGPLKLVHVLGLLRSTEREDSSERLGETREHHRGHLPSVERFERPPIRQRGALPANFPRARFTSVRADQDSSGCAQGRSPSKSTDSARGLRSEQELAPQSNSVALGSSPRAQLHVGGLRALGRDRMQGQVRTSYAVWNLRTVRSSSRSSGVWLAGRCGGCVGRERQDCRV